MKLHAQKSGILPRRDFKSLTQAPPVLLAAVSAVRQPPALRTAKSKILYIIYLHAFPNRYFLLTYIINNNVCTYTYAFREATRFTYRRAQVAVSAASLGFSDLTLYLRTRTGGTASFVSLGGKRVVGARASERETYFRRAATKNKSPARDDSRNSAEGSIPIRTYRRSRARAHANAQSNPKIDTQERERERVSL